MSETQRQVNQTYLSEVYSAVSQFTQAQVAYSVILSELKTSGKKLETETKPIIQQYINNLRMFERHAYIRLIAIQEQSGLNLSTIEEKRKSLETIIPTEEDTFLLAVAYQKLLATKLTTDILTTQQQMAGELTGKL